MLISEISEFFLLLAPFGCKSNNRKINGKHDHIGNEIDQKKWFY